MSRHQALPPLAREAIKRLADKLRDAEQKAKKRAAIAFPDDPIAARASALGTMYAIAEIAAADLDRVLAAYAPRSAR
jgi:hypothetical protein